MRRIRNLIGRLFGSDANGGGARDPHEKERIAALEGFLGKSEPAVRHAIVPLFMGGSPDYLIFKGFVPGFTYATVEMTDPSDPDTHERDGEFVICTREDGDWWDLYIRMLAFSTVNPEDKLETPCILDLSDVTDEQSPGVDGVLIVDISNDVRPFQYGGRRYPLYLVMVIQGSEVAYYDKHGGEALLSLLKKKSVFPFSEQYRESVAP